MKILNTPNVQQNSQRQNGQKANPSFKGGEAFIQVLNFLETNQALGATAVDVGCMGVPRTMTDFSRGPDAGLETMRREFSSTIVDALIGVYGIGAALLISQAFNKKYDVKAHKMLISDEALEISHDTWKESKGSMKDYLTQIAKKTKGFGENGWTGIDNVQEKFVNKMMTEVESTDKLSKEAHAYLKNLLANGTGAEKSFKLEVKLDKKGKDGEDLFKTAVSNLDAYIDDVYKVAKALSKKGVKDTFGNFDKPESVFFKKLKGLNKTTSIMGIAFAAALGCSLQPINMYLTRKKTGKTGFVGVEGREPDNTKGFKVLKVIAAATAGLAVLGTIGKKPSEVLSAIKFKGFFPTIPQYKFVYGFTIISRLLSARDKNELRESSIKDSLGFANWLILGGFVSKLTAAGFEKMARFKDDKFIRHNEAEHGKGFWKWLTEAPIVSREEILHTAFKKAKISTMKLVDGKEVAKTFKEMLKEAPKEVKTKIKYLGFIQMAGYVYSGIVLGVGIPKLNIAITNGIEKKRKAKLEAAKAAQPAVAATPSAAQTAAPQAKA